jgi:hypothetical protein
MRFTIVLVLAGGALATLACAKPSLAQDQKDAPVTIKRFAAPPDGKIYHGVCLGDVKDAGALGKALDAYLAAVTPAKRDPRDKIAWVQFTSDLSTKSADFPTDLCDKIREYGAVPFIRLMLKTMTKSDKKGDLSLKDVNDGPLPAVLDAWGKKARENNKPLLIEWGVDCNMKGSTLHGNPGEFQSAYKFIVTKVSGADTKKANIGWVFHINVPDVPETDANGFELYYPGDDYVDWIGVSIYGIAKSDKKHPTPFTERFDPYYDRILQKSNKSKPIMIAAFGCPNTGDASGMCWTREVFQSLIKDVNFPMVKGFSWWNSTLDYQGKPYDFQLQNNCIVGGVFQQYLPSRNIQFWPKF